MKSLFLSSRAVDPNGPPILDSLATFYVTINVLWTVIIIAGLCTVFVFRQNDYIRKRNPPLLITAVVLMHIYLSLMLMRYPLQGAYPCDFNFWAMSIYFPLGIAFFQAQNVQLLSVSAMQKELRFQRLKRPRTFALDQLNPQAIRKRWGEMTLLSRIYYGIGACAILQVDRSISHSIDFRSTAKHRCPDHPYNCHLFSLTQVHPRWQPWGDNERQVLH